MYKLSLHQNRLVAWKVHYRNTDRETILPCECEQHSLLYFFVRGTLIEVMVPRTAAFRRITLDRIYKLFNAADCYEEAKVYRYCAD